MILAAEFPEEIRADAMALQNLVDDIRRAASEQVQVDLERSVLDDREIRFQAALCALMQDKDARDFARANGPLFQKRYQLNDKQMIALALVAIHTGEATLHRELRDMQIQKSNPDAPVGSCCCSCP